MKRTLGLFLALALGIPSAAAAQIYGFKAGVTFTNIHTSPADEFDIESSAEVGWRAGTFVMISSGSRLSLEVDAIFALKRISFDVSNYKLSTLDIPVIVGLPLMKSSASTVRVIGGITPIFLFQAKESTTGNPPIGVKDAFETASLETFIGGQVDWNRWIFEGRYNFGLTEVYTEKVPGFDSRYRGFDISVGYRIR